MPTELLAPPASASPEALADWLELRALRSADRNSSLEDLVSALRAGGTIDAVPDDAEDEDEDEAPDRGSERVQAIAEAAFSELDDRVSSSQGRYPFTLSAQALQAVEGFERSVYSFLLLLSTEGTDAGPADLNATELFEDISGLAALSYLGGNTANASVYQFGFPRRRTPAGFRPALDDLCARMGEGRGARDRPTTRYQKDAKLDLVAWRDFPDAREGKIIAFGQCAAGGNWDEKVSELQATPFCQKWLLDQPTVTPVRMFFCPFRIERSRWAVTAYDAGVLFDRCRIVAHAPLVTAPHLAACERFVRTVLSGWS